MSMKVRKFFYGGQKNLMFVVLCVYHKSLFLVRVSYQEMVKGHIISTVYSANSRVGSKTAKSPPLDFTQDTR